MGYAVGPGPGRWAWALAVLAALALGWWASMGPWGPNPHRQWRLTSQSPIAALSSPQGALPATTAPSWPGAPYRVGLERGWVAIWATPAGRPPYLVARTSVMAGLLSPGWMVRLRQGVPVPTLAQAWRVVQQMASVPGGPGEG